jgi:hypothetical protein
MINLLPCVEVPKPDPLKISLPFGGEFKAMVDPSMGPPTDCSLAHSLMLQLTPMLGSMACLLKVLNVIAAMKKFFEEPTPNKIPGNAVAVADAIGQMTGCLDIVLGPIPIACMVVDILKMILAYINCMIEAVESLLNFQLSIDLNAANGNPVLLESLICAQNNANASMAGMNQGMQGIQPLIQLVNMCLTIVGQPEIELPDMSASTPTPAELLEGADPLEPIKAVRDVLQTAIDVLSKVCG